MYPESTIDSFTLPYDPKEAIQFIWKKIDENKYTLLIGSSLGGMYAYYMGVKTDLPSISLHPAYSSELFKQKIGNEFTRFDSSETYIITEKMYEYIDSLLKEIDTFKKYGLKKNAISLFNIKDDIINFEHGIKKYGSLSNIYVYSSDNDDNTHAFRNYELLNHIITSMPNNNTDESLSNI
jgi:predicted esterase YcpF (UPF0227 family)